MTSAGPLTDSFRGYLSEASKRRFTIVAGTLGAVFFLAQFVLPMLVMFAVMMPMMIGQAVSTADLDQAALWRGDLWFVERTSRLDWRDPEASKTSFALRRLRLSDLSPVGPALPLQAIKGESSPALLAAADRLWLIGAASVGSHDGQSLTQLSGAIQPRRATQPFVHEGRPAVLSLGSQPTLAVLDVRGPRAEWISREFPLGLPAEAGALRTLKAVDGYEGPHLIAELCTEEPERCSLSYRGPQQASWVPIVADLDARGGWTAVVVDRHPAVVLWRRERGRIHELEVVAVPPSGPRTEPIALGKGLLLGSRRRVFSQEGRLLVLSEGMPGSLRLTEVAKGRVTRSVKKTGSFPFGPRMMGLMLIPQLLPMVLSLVLALLLTAQMRRHRVRDYVVEAGRRAFASLWQRALAQLVDLVPLAAVFSLPTAWIWRTFSDPEDLVEKGPLFPLWFLGMFVLAAVAALLVLVGYSYLEGRFGKTPGKWLLGIRVLGTDLRPCGFGRAILRNLLTLVDGFFNFLVGALLVALTENWQRLGDLAARTIVVVDEKPA